MKNKYYVYVYLDPRKKDKFNYGDYEFDYEPFYVGKGKGNRLFEHLQKYSLSSNSYKNNKIKKIICDGFEPIIVKFYNNLSEKSSFYYEKIMIADIGRHDLKLGPLTNKTDGGEGSSGILLSEETKSKISDSLLAKNIVRSKKTRDKIGKANKGRKYSDEYLEYMKEIRKGPKLTHRKKFILISPENIKYEFLGRVELEKFIKENNLSVRKLLDSINKGIIKESDVRKVINGKKNKTINCIGWKIIKQ